MTEPGPLATVLWLRRRLAIHELAGVAGAVNLAAGVGLLTLGAVGSLAVAAGLAFVVHMAVLSGSEDAITGAWMLTFHTISFFALVVPLVVGAGTSSFDPSRLLGFPLSRSRLHRIALATESFAKIHLAWYPSLLAALVAGVLAPGPRRLAPAIVALLFAATMVAWSHAVVQTTRRVLRDRRLRELAAVLGLGLVVLLAFLPAVVDLTADDAASRLEELFTIPGWLEAASSVLPPSIAARSITLWRNHDVADAAIETGWLTLWLAAGLAASRLALDALLRGRGSHRARAGFVPLAGRLRPVLDIFGPVAAAVAEKELRYLLQSGVGKLNLVVTPAMAALAAVMSGRHAGLVGAVPALEHLVFLGVMLYAAAPMGYLQVNAFCWDGPGAATSFTNPVRPAEVLLGKNIGVWLFNCLFAVEVFLVWSAIRQPPPLTVAATGFLVFGSTTVLMTVLGNFTSIAFPVSRPIETVSSAASTVGTLAMIGCLLVGVAVAGLAMLSSSASGIAGLEMLTAAAAAGGTAALYRCALPHAAATMRGRREDILRSLAGS